MNPINFNSPDIIFRPKIQSLIDTTVVKPKVSKFLESRGIDFNSAIKINGKKSITDLNFASKNQIQLSYIYNTLFSHLRKRSQEIQPIFYSVCHDVELTKSICKETEIMYSTMFLGKKPIWFFIYFDLQEFFDAVRQFANNKIEL